MQGPSCLFGCGPKSLKSLSFWLQLAVLEFTHSILPQCSFWLPKGDQDVVDCEDDIIVVADEEDITVVADEDVVDCKDDIIVVAAVGYAWRADDMILHADHY